MTQEIAQFGRQFDINYLYSVDGSKAVHDSHRVTAEGHGSYDRIMGEGFPLPKSIQGWLDRTDDDFASTEEWRKRVLKRWKAEGETHKFRH